MAKLYTNFVRARNVIAQSFNSERESVRREAAMLAEEIMSDQSNIDEHGDVITPDGNVIRSANLFTYLCNFADRFNLG